LFYARSEAVEKDYLIRRLEIKDIVNGIVRKNAGRLIARRIKIEVSGSGEVYSDPKWLEFILQQLIDNSVKYGAKALAFEFAYHTLTVKDDGIGISQGDLPRIFEYGFTGENGRNTAKSTGMGLYLCKRLCDKLGIEITAASEGGTSIAISFPENPYVTFL
jgi:signal transduction histidine kinase